VVYGGETMKSSLRNKEAQHHYSPCW